MLWQPDARERARNIRNDFVSRGNPGILQSISFIGDIIRAYGPKGSVVSFNGGKDATITLYLFLAALAEYYDSTCSTPWRPIVVYFKHATSEFPEIRDFVHSQVELNGLEIRFAFFYRKP